MQGPPSNLPTDQRDRPPDSGFRPAQRVVMLAVIGLVFSYALWMLYLPAPLPGGPVTSIQPVLLPEHVALVTGDEPLMDIFRKAGCPVCHTIPGVPAAQGQVGPPLILGTTGPARLRDPSYRGDAKTVREYIVESVVDPGRFVVPGYPDRTMPAWYGSKLSGLALEKMAAYLGSQTELEPIH